MFLFSSSQRSPSKSKKSKAFKFATSKSKEKREKSRDKDVHRAADVKSSASTDKEVAAPSVADGTPIISLVSATLLKDKKKDKDKSKKDPKKKDKKAKQTSVSEEILELGDAQPIFGVSLGLAVVRSRCHDNVNLPLVIRDCIDYLQEHGLSSEAIYKLEGSKTRLQHLKRMYNNRESTGTDDWDVPTACGMLKLFFKFVFHSKLDYKYFRIMPIFTHRELPEPILTTDLSLRFEEAASLPQVTQQQTELMALVQQLPSYNCTLLAWTLRHFDEVIQHEAGNKTNAQSLAVLLSPTLQMSHRLLVCMLCHCSTLFEDTMLHK